MTDKAKNMEVNAALADEEVEGLEEDSQQTGWGEDYPLDAVFVRNEYRTVSEVVKRVDAGRYQLDPDFQRDFVWPIDKQSRLIESCTMRIPLPVFYVAEKLDGGIAVVDGLQRLTTFHRFLNDGFELVLKAGEKQTHHPLDGMRFSDLPIQLQERIEDTQLTLYILDAKAPERAKLDIFERVNNGVPLTRQQMRNCIFNGPATNWLKKAASSSEFLSASGRSLDKKTMRDREAINRFCAFYLLGESSYTSADMDDFLARALKEMSKPSADLELLSKRFKNSMQANRYLFGDHAFRKSLAYGFSYANRSVLNIALFDVCSVLFADASSSVVKENEEYIKNAFYALLDDSDFVNAITYSTNSTRQVAKRFEMARAELKDYLL
ncbi:DUF262 domain-containing protein [Vogesella indigofera]|uniref:DUF262 domain-containing protein n=1 Tax=Vogesella indigofera TaxID=45465 RepID=UPI00234F8C6C|nr:DUF262 domain-containing protein [Vogesella indigofera]MDC7699572.1 DUF262 domain-containing protein [Vogesella indigofera]